MGFFSNLKPIIRCATALERIAHCLEYFAIEHARDNGKFFLLTRPQSKGGPDLSDVSYTSREQIERLRAEEEEIILQRGYAGLEAYEAENE